jgi:hypothetical protein
VKHAAPDGAPTSFAEFALSVPDRQRLSQLIRAIPELAKDHDQIIDSLKGMCWEAIWIREAELKSPTKSDIVKQINVTRKKAADLVRESRRLEHIAYGTLDTARAIPKWYVLSLSIKDLYKALGQFNERTRWSRANLQGKTRGRKKAMAGRNLAFSVGALLHHYGVRTPKSNDGLWASLLEVLCPIAEIDDADVTNYMRAINPDKDFQP